MNTVTELLDAVRAHLAEFEVPPLFGLTVTVSSTAPQLSAHLDCQELPQIAAALLAWADTLSETGAEAWRVPGGDRMHLVVTGRLPSGASIQLYAGMPFPQRGIGADLAPGDRAPLLLGTLRHLAALGEVSA